MQHVYVDQCQIQDKGMFYLAYILEIAVVFHR